MKPAGALLLLPTGGAAMNTALSHYYKKGQNMNTALTTIDHGYLEPRGDCYDYHVRTFTNWMAETGNTDPFACVADYFRDLNASDYASGTIRMKRQAIKNRLRLAAERYITSPNEQFRLDQILKRLDSDASTKAPKLATSAVGALKVWSEHEYHQVLKNATERQQCFLRYLWQTGCRVSELTGAKILNAHRQGQTVDIRIVGKGNKERHVRITAKLFDRIRETFAGAEYLFETAGGKHYRRSYVSDQIAKLSARAIGRRLSAHTLRHTFATSTIKRTGKIAATSQYLGHSSVSTTLNMYTHEQLSDADLFGAEAAL